MIQTRRARRFSFSPLLVNGALALICLLWTIPTIGLLVSSFRTREDILSTGWWTILPHPDWTTVDTIKPAADLDRTKPMPVGGVTAPFEDFQKGVVTPDGRRLVWVGNRRAGVVQVQQREWTSIANFTTQNYSTVLSGQQVELIDPKGNKFVEQGADMSNAFINSLVVTIPSTLIPILIAAFAAYGFAWMRFPGRRPMFVALIALLVVPLQIALVPVLRDYTALNLNEQTSIA